MHTQKEIRDAFISRSLSEVDCLLYWWDKLFLKNKVSSLRTFQESGSPPSSKERQVLGKD